MDRDRRAHPWRNLINQGVRDVLPVDAARDTHPQGDRGRAQAREIAVERAVRGILGRPEVVGALRECDGHGVDQHAEEHGGPNERPQAGDDGGHHAAQLHHKVDHAREAHDASQAEHPQAHASGMLGRSRRRSLERQAVDAC